MTLLVDRLLPAGGCNYGNTFVLGQALRPHIQPTGLCLLALAGESVRDARIAKSRAFLLDSLRRPTATVSLAYALLALAAWEVDVPEQTTRLENAARRTLTTDRSPYRLALLALAIQHDRAPWMRHLFAGVDR